MASGETPIRKLPFPKTSDAPKVAGDIEELADALDKDMAFSNESRPAGIKGEVWKDPVYGILWYYDGSAWRRLNTALIPSDVYQPGVLRALDFRPTANTINGTTGALTFAKLEGTAFVPSTEEAIGQPGHEGTVLYKVESQTAKPTLLPGSLPTSGHYIVASLCLAQNESGIAGSEAEPVVSLRMGTEQATLAAAYEHAPANSGSSLRVRDVVILNTAGVYSIAGERDRRPWARGASVAASYTGQGTTFTGAETDSGLLSIRIECSGSPLLIAASVMAGTNSGSGVATAQLYMDGTGVGLTGIVSTPGGIGFYYPLTIAGFITPESGSHLFTLKTKTAAGEGNYGSGVVKTFTFRELPDSANNGTS